eukprot:3941232-Rhodomonas_salina.3
MAIRQDWTEDRQHAETEYCVEYEATEYRQYDSGMQLRVGHSYAVPGIPDVAVLAAGSTIRSVSTGHSIARA